MVDYLSGKILHDRSRNIDVKQEAEVFTLNNLRQPSIRYTMQHPSSHGSNQQVSSLGENLRKVHRVRRVREGP
ncbi:hypothetical protein PM082_000218 [Marasmius tenuissimus]|nr:hypothetical protein PM082_000218 [Marasmius tenuissimus]